MTTLGMKVSRIMMRNRGERLIKGPMRDISVARLVRFPGAAFFFSGRNSAG